MTVLLCAEKLTKPQVILTAASLAIFLCWRVAAESLSYSFVLRYGTVEDFFCDCSRAPNFTAEVILMALIPSSL